MTGLTDTSSLNDNVEIIEWDASTPALEALAREGRGKVRSVRRGHNLVVLAGRNLMRSLLIGPPPTEITHFGLGTSNTAVSDLDTALVAQVLREALTAKIAGSSTMVARYFLSTTQLNGTTIREAGLFNSPSGQTMFARHLVDPVIVKDNTLAFTFSWTITLTAP